MIQFGCGLALEMLQFRWYYVFSTDTSDLLEIHCKHLENPKSEQSTIQDLSECDQEQMVEFLHLSPQAAYFGCCL